MLLTDLGRRPGRDDAVRFDGHPTHRHDRSQLVFLVVGRGVLHVDGRPFALVDGEGVWLPAQAEHALELEPGGIAVGPTLGAAGEPPGRVPRRVDEPAIRRLVTTLLGVGSTGPAEIQAFRTALEDVLRAVAGEHFPLRRPSHPAARAVADEAVRSHATLRVLAGRQFVSARQVQRLFLEQTGLTFTSWRARARLNAAIACLHAGRGRDAALAASGFATRDGLLKALRREAGPAATLPE